METIEKHIKRHRIYNARMLVKDKRLKKSWVSGGKIHVIDLQDNRYVIETQADLDYIMRHISENQRQRSYADITSGRTQRS